MSTISYNNIIKIFHSAIIKMIIWINNIMQQLNSYNFLSCSLNQNLATLVGHLLHSNYSLKLHHIILQKVKNGELNDSNQEPISFDLYTAWKVIAESNGLTSAASCRWSLDAVYRNIHHYFTQINYEEIKKMEKSQQEITTQLIQKYAEEADSIANTYQQKAQTALIDFLNTCHRNAYDRYNWMMESRKALKKLITEICLEVTANTEFKITIDETNSIFNCTMVENLIYIADYYSLAPRDKDVSWLMYELSFGDDPIYKFFNIQTTLLLLIAIREFKAKSLNTDQLSANEIKKFAKSVHKISEIKLKPLHAELRIQGIVISDLHTKALNEIYTEMLKMLDKLEHSKIPLIQPVSEEDARKLG